MPDIYCPLCGFELTEAEAELIAFQVLRAASIDKFNRLIEIWKASIKERPDDSSPPMKVEHPDTQALLREYTSRKIDSLVCDVYRRSVEDQTIADYRRYVEHLESKIAELMALIPQASIVTDRGGNPMEGTPESRNCVGITVHPQNKQ